MTITVNHLITKALQTKDVGCFRRINPVVFNDTDKGYIDWTLDHISKYHQIPTLDMFRETFPNFIPVKHDGNIEYLFDNLSIKLCDSHARARLAAVKFPTVELIREIAEETTILSGNSIAYQDVDPGLYFTEQKILKTNVPFIKDTIEQIMGSDFLLIVGRMKNQKTHVSQVLLLDLLRNYNGILFTNEITALEYAGKLDAIIAGSMLANKRGFDTKVYRTQDESEEIREALKAAAEYRKEHLGKLKIYTSIRSVSEMYSAVNASEHSVDFVMIDGMHFMGSNAGGTSDKAQSMRGISNEVKMFCTSQNIPTIAVSQSSRAAEGKERADASSIALSDALAQDATAVYYSYALPKERLTEYPDGTTIALVSPVVSRFGGEDGHPLKTDWHTTYTRWLVPDDFDRDIDDVDIDISDFDDEPYVPTQEEFEFMVKNNLNLSESGNIEHVIEELLTKYPEYVFTGEEKFN